MATIDIRDLINEIGLANEITKQIAILGRDPKLEFSLSKKCFQYLWSIPYCFPSCPQKLGANPIDAYANNLRIGAVFAHNEDSQKLIVVDLQIFKVSESILVICKSEEERCENEGYMPWSVHKIVYIYGYFLHIKLGGFLEREEAQNEYDRLQELELDKTKRRCCANN